MFEYLILVSKYLALIQVLPSLSTFKIFAYVEVKKILLYDFFHIAVPVFWSCFVIVKKPKGEEILSSLIMVYTFPLLSYSISLGAEVVRVDIISIGVSFAFQKLEKLQTGARSVICAFPLLIRKIIIKNNKVISFFILFIF